MSTTFGSISENSRQGFDGIIAGMCLASMEANSSTASGLEFDLRWESTGSNSSARWYDPQARRFISEDPIGLNGGINLYAYVGNNPINYVDPFGLSPKDVELIMKTFHETVKQMTEAKQRTSPGAWNNFISTFNDRTRGLIGTPHQGCADQAATLNNNLVNKKYEDYWDFEINSGGFFHSTPHTWGGFGILPHSWLKATSKNTNDPIIIMDPYNNIIKALPFK